MQLLTLAVGALLAFGAYVLQDPEPQIVAPAVYAALSLVPVIGLCQLIWEPIAMGATARPAIGLIPRPTHAFDRPTIRMAATSAGIVLVGTMVVLLLYRQGLFLTQSPTTSLDIASVGSHKFGEGAEGIDPSKLGVAARFSVERRFVTDPPILPIENLRGLPPGWKVVNVIGYETGSDGGMVRTDRQPVFEAEKDSDGREAGSIVWLGLNADRQYRLDILLYPFDSAVSAESVVALIKAGKAIDPRAHNRQ